MLKLLFLLTLAIAGHNAFPLRKAGTGHKMPAGRMRQVPLHRPMRVALPAHRRLVPGVHRQSYRQKPVQTANPADNRRQGTEPSRRFLVDLNTGLLKDYVGEMSRRPSGFYVPPSIDGFRQGTENSHATLVDPRTGLLLQPMAEMQRGHIADINLAYSDEFRHGIEYSQAKIKDAQGKDSAKEGEVVAVPLIKGGWVREAVGEESDPPSGFEELNKQDQVPRAAPVENRRQGTEPSRRFLVDLNTGLLKDYVGEMSRRPSGFYVPPPSDGFRQGTENSHATLVDPRTGLLLQPMAEMQRGHIADEFRHPVAKVTEMRDNPVNTVSEASLENRRQGTEPSRRFLVDLNTGLLKDYVGEMSRRPSGFYVPPSIDGFRQGTENSHATLVDPRTGLLLQPMAEMQRGHIADEFRHPVAKVTELRDNPVNTVSEASLENRRQGTEPSRRFLVDLNTGLLKDYVDEMSRRPSGFYVPPPSDGFRQGTENSHATLVDPRTGLLLQPMAEMQRGHIADEFRHPVAKVTQLRDNPVNTVSEASLENRRQGTEPSRRFLVDLNTGLLKDYVGEMSRRPSGFYVPPSSDGFRQGTENSHATLVDPRTGLLLQPMAEMQRGHIADEFRHPVAKVTELRDNPVSTVSEASLENRRQGTEPSRRFLVDLNTGLLKDYVGEMSRRPSGFYVPPPSDGFRQGTENSHATLVDPRTGLLLQPMAEMQRGHIADTSPVVLDEFKHGIEYSQSESKAVRQNEIMDAVEENDEFSHGIDYSHFKIRNEIMEPAVQTDTAVWIEQTVPEKCPGQIIDGRCYQFNPTPLTFSEAESFCQDLYADGHIAAVTSADLHASLASMVSIASNGPTLTWLGGVKKGQQYKWLDGSAWGYTDWMPGHPNLQRGKATCVEMFRMEASWWTSVDCNLKRASICSFPITA